MYAWNPCKNYKEIWKILIKCIYKKSTLFLIYLKNYRDCGYTCNPRKFEIPTLWFPRKVPVNPCKHLQCRKSIFIYRLYLMMQSVINETKKFFDCSFIVHNCPKIVNWWLKCFKTFKIQRNDKGHKSRHPMSRNCTIYLLNYCHLNIS